MNVINLEKSMHMIRNTFLYYTFVLCLGGSLLLSGCSDDDKDIPTPKPNKEEVTKRATTDEQYYANLFAHDILEYYYVWNEEIASDLTKLDPETNVDPIKTVYDIRYHKGDKEIDKWTTLIKDMKKFQDGVAGISTTYGYQPITYLLRKGSKECISAVAYVCKNSPAEKAGLKRGDLIYMINGEKLTTDNYKGLFDSSTVTISLAKLQKSPTGDGGSIVPIDKDVTMNAVEMYEDPVLLDSIYEVNGKKVGYLAYSSFDLASIPTLINISKKFKSEGVKELILDFRYNGGGYVITENAMASMYAPKNFVDAKAIFEKEKYNKQLTKEFKDEGEDTSTPFRTNFVFKDEKGQLKQYSTEDANIGIDKVYGIITQNTASASEALLGGLMPYMDVDVIGTPSHGKYCTGWMVSAEKAYKKVPQPIKDWGIYVMVSIYQNAKGETPCMPNGMQPNFLVDDDPMMPEQLGDVNEIMLKAALQRAGKVYSENDLKSRVGNDGIYQQVYSPQRVNFGKRILLFDQLPCSHNQ